MSDCIISHSGGSLLFVMSGQDRYVCMCSILLLIHHTGYHIYSNWDINTVICHHCLLCLTGFIQTVMLCYFFIDS